MPSSLNLNGTTIFRPGVYAEIDASALGGQTASTGNVCVVGSFPTIEQYQPLTFTSAQSIVRFDHSDQTLAHIGRVAFAPSLDERIPAGANTLTVLNVAGNSQAQVTLNRASSAPSAGVAEALTLKSRVWGDKGNRTQVTVANTNTDQVDITVAREGKTETFEGIESGDVASIYYDGSLLDTVGITGARLNPGVEYTWTQEEAFANGTVQFDVSDIVSNSVLSFRLGSGASTANVTVTVSGTDNTGASISDTLTFGAGDITTQTTTAEFHTVTLIQAQTTDTAFSDELVVGGTKSLDVADFNTLAELIETIDQFPSVVATYAVAKSYAADAFDYFASTDIVGSTDAVSVRCDTTEIIDALKSSQLIVAERPAQGIHAIAESVTIGSNTYSLAGGTSSLATLSNWTTALEGIESADIQIIVPWSGSDTYHKEVKKHLRKAALAGRERNAWAGAAARETLDQLNARARSLNDRNIALVGQQVKLIDPLGNTVTRDPIWLALMLACMQAGSPVATPLTRKRPDVVDVLGLWDGNKDASEAIQKGISSLSFGPLGWRVERSVTTYLTDDNPIYSEVSANESVNASVRDLRAGLDSFVGQPNRSLTANRIKSIVESRLNRQVLDGVIKAFKDVVLEDLGDTLNVNYTVAAVEPINFIRITASVARF